MECNVWGNKYFTDDIFPLSNFGLAIYTLPNAATFYAHIGRKLAFFWERTKRKLSNKIFGHKRDILLHAMIIIQM